MAFLDNSGDIILDAVLTDTGRYRLAQGNGSFKIAKFALGDDEINYSAYNKNNPSGSAYYDLEILQTPILEAFTNNTSTMKSKLLTIPRTNLLYLPVILMNNSNVNSAPSGSSELHLVCVDEDTVGRKGLEGFLVQSSGMGGTGAASEKVRGFLNGFQAGSGVGAQQYIQCDQGLNTNEISANAALDSDLYETQYIVEMDNRLGAIVPMAGQGANQYNVAGVGGVVTAGTFAGTAKVSFVDDDNIASYYFSLASDAGMISDLASTPSQSRVITGPQGTTIQFRVQASTELQTSTYLFEKLGSTTSITKPSGASQSVRYIDSVIKVTGATTGYSINLLVRYIKSII